MATRGSTPPSEEARLHHMAYLSRTAPHSAWSGWVTFASYVLLLTGSLNAFQGVVALFDEGYFVVPRNEVFLVSYDAWGVVLLAWGAVLVLIGAALYARREWARVLAILGVMLNVVMQVGFFPTLPLLALILIALDVTVLFALTARWAEARDAY